MHSESTNLRRSGGSGFRTLDSRIWSVIRIATRIVSLGPWAMPYPSKKFRQNPFTSLRVIRWTDRQTDRQTDRTKNITSFFGGGNNLIATSICFTQHSVSLVNPRSDQDNYTADFLRPAAYNTDAIEHSQCYAHWRRKKQLPVSSFFLGPTAYSTDAIMSMANGRQKSVTISLLWGYNVLQHLFKPWHTMMHFLWW